VVIPDYITPVMHIDSDGHAWWHIAIGVAIIALAVGVTIATGGAAAGTLVFAINGIAQSMAIGAATGALIGGAFSGLSTNENGGLSFNLENASKGFLMGSITGAIAGGLSSTSHLLGESLIKTTTLLKRVAYVGMQAAINSGISASITAISGLATHSFSWSAVGISAGFGAFSGAMGVFPGISDGFRGFSIGFGMGFAEGSLNEAFEWNSIWSNNQSGTFIFDFAN